MPTHIPSPDGTKLVAAMQSGNEEAWNTFFDRYIDRLRSDAAQSLQARGLSPERADEVCVRTWFIAVKRVRRDGFKNQGEEKLYRFIRVIARNITLEMSREQAKQQPVVSLDRLRLEDKIDGFAFKMHLIADPITEVDEHDQVRQAAIMALAVMEDLLSQRDKEIFIDYFCHDYSLDTLSQKHGIEAKSVKRAISRAQNRVREFLESNRQFQQIMAYQFNQKREPNDD